MISLSLQQKAYNYIHSVHPSFHTNTGIVHARNPKLAMISQSLRDCSELTGLVSSRHSTQKSSRARLSDVSCLQGKRSDKEKGGQSHVRDLDVCSPSGCVDSMILKLGTFDK